MAYETAGDPMTGLKWTRKTTQKVTNELKALGIKEVNRTTVGRLLKDLGYSLKVNHKKRALGPKKHPKHEPRGMNSLGTSIAFAASLLMKEILLLV